MEGDSPTLSPACVFVCLLVSLSIWMYVYMHAFMDVNLKIPTPDMIHANILDKIIRALPGYPYVCLSALPAWPI